MLFVICQTIWHNSASVCGFQICVDASKIGLPFRIWKKNGFLHKLARFRTALFCVSGRPARRWLPYGNDIIVCYARFPRLLLFTTAIYRRCTTSCAHRANARASARGLHSRGNARSFGFTVDYIIIIAVLSLITCDARSQRHYRAKHVYRMSHYHSYLSLMANLSRNLEAIYS